MASAGTTSSDGKAVNMGNAVANRMNAFENFVKIQSDAALRQVAGQYAYDDNEGADGELTLRSGGEEINDQLEQKLNERLAMAGIEGAGSPHQLPGLCARDCGRDAAPPAGVGHHQCPREDCRRGCVDGPHGAGQAVEGRNRGAGRREEGGHGEQPARGALCRRGCPAGGEYGDAEPLIS